MVFYEPLNTEYFVVIITKSFERVLRLVMIYSLSKNETLHGSYSTDLSISQIVKKTIVKITFTNSDAVSARISKTSILLLMLVPFYFSVGSIVDSSAGRALFTSDY